MLAFPLAVFLIRVCTNVVAVYVFEGSIKDNVWYCSTFPLAVFLEHLNRVCTNVVAVYLKVL